MMGRRETSCSRLNKKIMNEFRIQRLFITFKMMHSKTKHEDKTINLLYQSRKHAATSD